MANVKEEFGLRPYRKLDGTPLVGAQNRYTIASNMGHAIYQGDLVIVTTAVILRNTIIPTTVLVYLQLQWAFLTVCFIQIQLHKSQLTATTTQVVLLLVI